MVSLRRLASGGAVLACVAVSATGTVAPTAATGIGSLDCERAVGDVDHAKRLRSAVGLPNGDALVANSFESANYSCQLAGIPLSPEEEAALLETAYTQAELSHLAETVAGNPSFAGAWLDGDQLTIASVDGELGAGLSSEKGSIHLVRAPLAKSELDAVAEEIGELSMKSDIGPIVRDITYVAVDERSNRVRVGVVGDVDGAKSAFAGRYGDVVSVYYAEPSGGEFLVCNVNDCGTKGGLAINHDAPGVACTSGFVGKSKLYGGSTYSHRMITAGHCIQGAGGASNPENWHNPALTKTWGSNKAFDFVRYEYPDSCPVVNTYCVYNDLGLFGLGSNLPTVKHEYFWSGSPGWVEIETRTAKSGQLEGQVVWRYGRTSGLDAGEITAKPTFVTQEACAPSYTCRNYNAVEVDLTSAPGDSGSGFFRLLVGPQGDAFGVLSFGKAVAGNTYYYAWDQPFYAGVNFTDRRTVYPCISPDCPL